jgi:hypothetical protein
MAKDEDVEDSRLEHLEDALPAVSVVPLRQVNCPVYNGFLSHLSMGDPNRELSFRMGVSVAHDYHGNLVAISCPQYGEKTGLTTEGIASETSEKHYCKLRRGEPCLYEKIPLKVTGPLLEELEGFE